MRNSRSKIRMLRDWGQDRKYHHVLRGFNYRMEGFPGGDSAGEAAPSGAVDRGAPRNRSSSTTNCWPTPRWKRPKEMPWARHVYHVYTLRSQDRDGLQCDAASGGNSDRCPLSRARAPAARLCRLGLWARSLPSIRKAADAGTFAATLPRAFVPGHRRSGCRREESRLAQSRDVIK